MRAETPVAAYVRAYTETPGAKRSFGGKHGLDSPSEFSVIFDCETTTDPRQTLRFGFFQVRKSGALVREGIFYEPSTLAPAELELLQAYAARSKLDICTVRDFRFKVLLRVGYEARAAIVGFNLPFDISRIALDWGEERGSLRGGFSFKLSEDRHDPAIRVKHLSATTALIDFAVPGKQLTPRGMRNRGLKERPHRGYFHDVKTLAAALHSRKFSLGALTKFLQTKTQKHEGVEYDGPLTETFIEYARADVQATWECFEKLRDLYASYRLPRPLHRIQSEASIGKASLEAMRIEPLLQHQPDTSREEFGRIMATYLGGRAEVRIRRQVRQVLLTDFKSMYPTVNTLMGLGAFVVADGYTHEDTTAETQALIDKITLDDLQRPETWRRLATIVQLRPSDDILPLRTRYSEDRDALTIGLNHVRSDIPLWYTLADVIVSKLLNGRAPRIDKAVSFRPGPVQTGLEPISLLGRPAFSVDPASEPIFKRLVDMRDETPKRDPANQAIKIIVNSTSYGVFVEVNRDDAPKPEPIMVFGSDREGRLSASKALEEPGKFFHPLCATLITGAARLMLGIAERLVIDRGLDWVFCDTDSIAMAKPDDVTAEEFIQCAQSVVDWFVPLNPYEKDGSILKIEDINYGLNTEQFEPLFAYAISAKRYALFNFDADGRPVIRKFSAHGLGHLMDPYPESDPAPGVPEPLQPVGKLGGRRWQYDFWYHIVCSALAGKPGQVCRDYHTALSAPAMARYGATSPALLRWMKPLNEAKSYADQVKPFGFLVAFMAKGASTHEFENILDDQPQRGRPSKHRMFKPIAPFERDPTLAVSRALDRETGEPVPASALKTYAEALQFYHVSPEDKFANGGPVDTGTTKRRHLLVTRIQLIGKEANKVGDAGEPDPVSSAVAEFGATGDEAASDPDDRDDSGDAPEPQARRGSGRRR